MNEIQSTNAQREDAYRLLAACFYPPTPELLEENCCGALATLLGSVAPAAAQAAEDAAAAGSETTIEALAVEHARLFIGPFQLIAPPYGSVYLDDSKTVMGDSTAKVAAFYHACGLHLADDFHELPDHFAVELEFMSYLVHKQREAEGLDDKDEVAAAVSLQLEFLDRFLMPWVVPFTSAIIVDGEAPFYKAIARSAAAFIAADYNTLNSKNNG